MKNDYVPLEKLLEASNGSIYRLTALVAQRARSLAEGEKPLIDKPKEKVIDTALEEIKERKIRVKKDKK
ncbi:MAG: DNA-directed RNA polymerase subunit omega [Candidatus Omnitrophica bacterium]|nr:DNA-directed RNA polymerase subunit omega [Candidatus Omnitrophota bacterium]